MEILLIRHGESTANTERVFSNTGWRHGLTEKGIEQARYAAEMIIPFFGRPGRIYASGLRRANETAAIIAESVSIEMRTMPELAEVSVGVLEGKSDSDSWRLHNSIWDRWFLRGDADARIPGGESLREATLRFRGAIRRLEEEEGQDSRIALVTHGGFILSGLLNLVYGVPEFIPRRGYLGNCDMVSIRHKDQALTYVGYSPGLRGASARQDQSGALRTNKSEVEGES